MRIVAVARRRERLEQLQAHLLSLNVPASDVLPIMCDVTKEAEIQALIKIIAKRCGWVAALCGMSCSSAPHPCRAAPSL